jgi:hypothetical protein
MRAKGLERHSFCTAVKPSLPPGPGRPPPGVDIHNMSDGLAMAPSTCLVEGTGGRRLAMFIRNSLATHRADFHPDLKRLGSGSSVLGSSDVIAAEME